MRHIETREDMTETEFDRLERYLAKACDSGCGKDKDCPHEESFIEMLNDEIEAKFEADLEAMEEDDPQKEVDRENARAIGFPTV